MDTTPTATAPGLLPKRCPLDDESEQRLRFAEHGARDLDDAIFSLKHGVDLLIDLCTNEDGHPKAEVDPEVLAILFAWKAALPSWESAADECGGYVMGVFRAYEEATQAKQEPAQV